MVVPGKETVYELSVNGSVNSAKKVPRLKRYGTGTKSMAADDVLHKFSTVSILALYGMLTGKRITKIFMFHEDNIAVT